MTSRVGTCFRIRCSRRHREVVANAVRVFLLCVFCLAGNAAASQLVDGRIESKLVPSPAEFAVLLPDGYETAHEPFPLLLMLHGGGGDKSALARLRPVIEEMWKAGTLPPMVIATPSVTRSFYVDFRDGSQKWETFIVTAFMDHLRATFNVTKEYKRTLLFGISMGGMGALRLGFKYPEKFGGLAALEPGVDPALKWKELQPRNKFWRSQELMEKVFGKPFDEAYWEANNPATMALASAEKLRASGLSIYIDAGDEDSFLLHEGTEFMHRVLWDQKIPHEYHLVRGADHVGATLRPRSIEGLQFLARVLNPPPPDPQARAMKRRLAPLRKQADDKRD